MKKEYVFIGLVGLYLFTYLLDALVDPFQLQRATPYAYLAPEVFAKYPFTMLSILLKALLLFLAPLWTYSFFNKNFGAKAVILFVISALLQLYSIQQIATAGIILPLEWTIALAFGGAALLFPAIGYAVMGSFAKLHTTIHQQVTHTEKELAQQQAE